jgi:hypothetical protein
MRRLVTPPIMAVSFRLLVAGVCVLSPIACATTGSIRSAPLSAGMARTFAAELPAVMSAAREAMVEAGLTIEESRQVNDTTWMIIGQNPASIMSYGEIVRVVVEKAGAAGTAVRVHSKRRVATNVTAKGDYSPRILSYIEFKLR